MSRWGGENEPLYVDLIIPDNSFPAAPGFGRHAGQGDPGRLTDAYAKPPGSRPIVHKDGLLGVWSHGPGAACEVCDALLDADP